MLSTFPATLSSDSFFGNPFPPFEPGFPPWDSHEPAFNFDLPSPKEQEPVPSSPQPSPEPVSPNSGSDTSNPVPVTSNSGSDDPNRKRPRKSGSGSQHASVIDERKRRRMISNRESARRSRARKQKHLENLRNQVNRLRVGNRDLMNRLRLVVHQNQMVRRENECLRSEAVVLRQRLWDIRQVLLVRQLQQHLNLPVQTSAWPCNNVMTSVNDQGQLSHHSLIT